MGAERVVALALRVSVLCHDMVICFKIQIKIPRCEDVHA